MKKSKNFSLFLAFVILLLMISFPCSAEDTPADINAVANFTADVTCGPAPLMVQFTDSSVNATNQTWSFGDETTSEEQNPLHIFESPGLFNVSLHVWNEFADDWHNETGLINVTQPLPDIIPNFTTSVQTGYAPLEVRLYDTSIGDIFSWQWDFGDGSTSNETNPVYTYIEPGQYTVSLTACNRTDACITSKKEQYISVSAREVNPPETSSINITWHQRLGGSGVDGSSRIIQTNDGGYVLVGNVTSCDGDVIGCHGGRDIWVVKLDSSGWIEWQNCLGGSGNETGRDIQQTADGGYIIAGSTTSTDGDLADNEVTGGAWVVKLGPGGQHEWDECYGDRVEDEAFGILQTDYGEYFVAGNFYPIEAQSRNIWVARLNASGVVDGQIWLGGWNEDTGNRIRQTDDGHFIITGTATSYDITGNEGGVPHLWVIKVQADLGPDWSYTETGGEGIFGHDVCQTADGGFAVAATLEMMVMPAGGNATLPRYERDSLIVKLNASGGREWGKTPGIWGPDEALSILQTPGGGYVIAGWSENGSGTEKDRDIRVLKLDKSGLLELEQSFGGSGVDEIYSIQQTNDFGFIAAGSTNSADGDLTGIQGNDDAWILKLPPIPPIAGFTSDVLSGPSPLTVQFSDTSTCEPDVWQWDFGDGTLSDLQNPSHTYTESGIYTVSLRVSNQGGEDILERSDYITSYVANYSVDAHLVEIDPQSENFTFWLWGTPPDLRQILNLHRADCTGTIVISGNDVMVYNANPSLELSVLTVDSVSEEGGIISGLVNHAMIRTGTFTATIPGIGTVNPYIVMHSVTYPDSAILDVQVIKGVGADDQAEFSGAAAEEGRVLQEICYSLKVNPEYLDPSNASIIFTVPRTWSDVYGAENIRIFRHENSGNTSILTTEVLEITSTDVTFMGISPGFSTFTLAALEPVVIPDGGDESSHESHHKEYKEPENIPEDKEPPVLEEELEPVLEPPLEEPLPQVEEPEVIPDPLGAAKEALTTLSGLVQAGGGRGGGLSGSGKNVPAQAVLPKETIPAGAVATGITLSTAYVAAGMVAQRSGTNIFATVLSRIFGFLKANFTFITDFMGENVLENIADKEASLLSSGGISSSSDSLWGRSAIASLLSGSELWIIGIGAILYGAAFTLADRIEIMPVTLGAYILVCGVAVASHELTHHIIARQYNVQSRVKFNFTGILVSFFTAWFFGNVFAQPLMTDITGMSEKKQKGITMLAGPVVSLIFGILFLFLIPFGGIWTLAGITGFSVNLLEAVYSLIPIHPMDGKMVAGWNIILWALLFIPIITSYLILYAL